MTRSRTVAATAALAAIALAVLSVAAPAQGATLPDGQTLTMVDDRGQITYTADPATAALTPVGPTVVGPDRIIMGVDVNDSGLGYLITSTGALGLAGQGDIHTYDATTGSVGAAVPLVFEGPDAVPLSGSYSLDLAADGTLWTSGFGDNFRFIGTVEPTTGVVHIEWSDDQFLYLMAVASDPLTGDLWVFSAANGSGVDSAAVLDTATGVLGEPVELSLPVFSTDFASNGQLFGTTWSPEGEADPALVTVDLTSGDVSVVGDYPLEGDPINIFHQPSLTVWGAIPEAALAATGMDVAPLGLGAALLLLAGAALVLTRRIETRVSR